MLGLERSLSLPWVAQQRKCGSSSSLGGMDVGDVGRLPIPEPIVEFEDAPGDVDEEEYGEVINRSDGVDMS